MKLGFKDRGQKSSNHFLCHTIPDHRYAERSQLLGPRAFGNIDSTQWPGPETSCFQVPHKRREVLLKVRLKHFDAHLVYPGGPSVPLDRLECLSHELGRNSPCQRVYLDLLHDKPFTRCHHGVQTAELLGDVS